MHSIARPASRLVHARLGTANLSRWRTLAALPSPRHNLTLSSSSPSSRRFYSDLPPIFAPPPPKEEPKQASPTSTSSTTSSDPSAQSSDATTASSSTAPDSSSSSSSTPDNDTTTSSSSSSSSSSPKPDPPKNQSPDDPLPDTATKIYTALPPALSEKLSHLMDTAQTRLLTASTTLNTLTGYAPIEEIKRQNTLLETRLAQAQDLVRTARTTYKTTNAKRATTQREVTTLLARKEMWSPTDLERFTQLYRQDHSLEQEVAAASEALTDAEHAEQALGQQLNAGILKRYHEEQIWSDRIRRASTWGTWGLMGVNVLLFIVLQFIAEPWKRRRLVRGVVEEEKAVLEGVTAELAGLKAALAQREAYDDAATADDVAAYMASTMAATGTTTPAAAVEEETPLAGAEPTSAEEAEELLAAKVEEPAVQHEMEREVASALEVLETQVPEAKSWRESWRELLADPELLKAKIADLYSERRIDLRMRDASILALEGAAAGATFAAALALLLVRRT
ncbi:She9/Mdm33 family protein [Colletotrichum scovillei]|uniref:Sensitive to high expression protein 9, mitochondrial n=1 Tax=Colletotrichum scovillei TaxID=1209932 RepID=A0A9P7QTU9_9PEZI|nr:She9/Mdm33 family protein [Colletotrichum scovillei]KAF4778671.1 She9/Mdm33 family protein [Colletotrichum scovillei]KAG7039884.1 She9/Mdm33 family protein [Colletotrichum scovillei]KAG7042059.1 She9/Mdm33 family protein [Colletotrichum scovillei]KAG7062090.1 She9/Mdm33 family protein [Colletotrichum scovillei]